MGIRYFGLAFDAALCDIARDHPERILRRDPWDGLAGVGCPPHCVHDPEDWLDTCRGKLYLERAWIDLQRLTRPADGDVARPAYRMFEGDVAFDAGWDEIPWVRVILPDDVVAIRDDLRLLISGFTIALRTGCEDYLPPATDCFDYDLSLLEQAELFASCLVADRRGMVYEIA